MILGIVEMKYVSERKENEVIMKGIIYDLYVINLMRLIKLLF